MNRILIVEDEPKIVSFISKGLRANGFVTMAVDTVNEALLLANSKDFDLLILDIGLPDGDGISFLEQLRGQGEYLPAIILSAYEELDSKITGLEAGANDYITKPFRFAELLARIRVQLRDRHETNPSSVQSSTILRVGSIELNLLTREVNSDKGKVALSAREFTLLEVFMRHEKQLMSRQELLDHVWGYDHDPGSNVVDAHIRNLRRKVGHECIETVRGSGYRFKG